MAESVLLRNGTHRDGETDIEQIQIVDTERETSRTLNGTENPETVDGEKEDSCCWCHPRWPSAIAYLLAIISYMAGMNVKRLPREPFEYGNLLPVKMPSDWLDGVSMLMFMWNFHFVRRFAEVLLVHIYTKRINLLYTLGAPIYYAFFGLWIGWSMNYNFGYDAPPLYLLVPGATLFVIGQIGNFVCHIMLRRLRTASKINDEDTRKFRRPSYPEGFVFKLVVCPHYTFEIITWIGYSVAAFTFPCFLFLLASFITLMVLSRKRLLSLRKAYKGDHREEVLSKKKAIIPFIF